VIYFRSFVYNTGYVNFHQKVVRVVKGTVLQKGTCLKNIVSIVKKTFFEFQHLLLKQLHFTITKKMYFHRRVCQETI